FVFLTSALLFSCGTITNTVPGSLSTVCCNGWQGRYVTITIPGRAEHLTLCEVEVLSQSCAPPPGAQNLALGRLANQSSTFEDETGKAVAGRAVDGKHDGKFEQGSCSLTKLDIEPWWIVDLGRRHSISMVIVKHREDKCCGERLQGAQIRVGVSRMNHGKHNPLCGTITDTRPGSISTICCNRLAGRYVTIVIPDREEYLNLCEVEVLSQGCAPPLMGKELAQWE
uniref:Fucolectin tachylectin-4 pentraxin-1 domain-containing protein n=1 Tax=Pelodiscus sinensis TaxID=13735 RepID=K7F5D6_PELSI